MSLRYYLPVICLVWLCGCEKPSETETAPHLEAPTVSSSPASSSHFLSEPKGLIQLIEQNEKKLRIVDVRPLAKYERGHIPGAAHVNLADWKGLTLSDGGFTNVESWSEKVTPLGIDPEQTRVVVYGENPTNATRTWWTLKYLGVQQVSVLNGGWKGWIDHAGETQTETPEIAAIPFEPVFQSKKLITLNDLKKGVEEKSVLVLDARSEEEYETHIPQAIHLEWKDLVQPDGRFKTEAELKKLIDPMQVGKDQQIATYCQSGGRASLNMFVFEMLGYENVQNYYCSWSEWGSDESAPKEKAEEPPQE